MTVAAKNKNIVSGKLTTPPRCMANRSVSVYSAAGVLHGTAVIDAAGNWQMNVDPNLTPGSYYATVTAKRLLKNRRHKHICRGVRTDFQAA